MTNDSVSLLKEAIFDPSAHQAAEHSKLSGMSANDTVFTVNFYDELNGMLQTNVADTKIYSPLNEYTENLQEVVPQVTDNETLQQVLKLASMIREIHATHGTFPHAHGGGLHLCDEPHDFQGCFPLITFSTTPVILTQGNFEHCLHDKKQKWSLQYEKNFLFVEFYQVGLNELVLRLQL
jgi:hypothetical protein